MKTKNWTKRILHKQYFVEFTKNGKRLVIYRDDKDYIVLYPYNNKRIFKTKAQALRFVKTYMRRNIK